MSREPRNEVELSPLRMLGEQPRCPVCNDPPTGNLWICPTCHSMLHTECQQYTGGCATFGCRDAAPPPPETMDEIALAKGKGLALLSGTAGPFGTLAALESRGLSMVALLAVTSALMLVTWLVLPEISVRFEPMNRNDAAAIEGRVLRDLGRELAPLLEGMRLDARQGGSGVAVSATFIGTDGKTVSFHTFSDDEGRGGCTPKRR